MPIRVCSSKVCVISLQQVEVGRYHHLDLRPLYRSFIQHSRGSDDNHSCKKLGGSSEDRCEMSEQQFAIAISWNATSARPRTRVLSKKTGSGEVMIWLTGQAHRKVNE